MELYDWCKAVSIVCEYLLNYYEYEKCFYYPPQPTAGAKSMRNTDILQVIQRKRHHLSC